MDYFINHVLMSPIMIWLGVHIAWLAFCLVAPFLVLAWLIGILQGGDRDRARRDEAEYMDWQMQQDWLHDQEEAHHRHHEDG